MVRSRFRRHQSVYARRKAYHFGSRHGCSATDISAEPVQLPGQLPEAVIQRAMYDISEDSTTLHRTYMQGWLDQEAEILMVKASKILRHAVKIAESK